MGLSWGCYEAEMVNHSFIIQQICRDWRAKTIVAVQAERSDGKQGYDFVRFF